MKITEHFDSTEFSCNDEAKTEYPSHLIKTILTPLCKDLEKIRALTNQPMTIISAYRTPSHNSKIPGSAKNSEHCKGTAVDISLKGMTGFQLYKAILHLIKNKVIRDGGVSYYQKDKHVHYDHGKPRRW